MHRPLRKFQIFGIPIRKNREKSKGPFCPLAPQCARNIIHGYIIPKVWTHCIWIWALLCKIWNMIVRVNQGPGIPFLTVGQRGRGGAGCRGKSGRSKRTKKCFHLFPQFFLPVRTAHMASIRFRITRGHRTQHRTRQHILIFCIQLSRECMGLVYPRCTGNTTDTVRIPG